MDFILLNAMVDEARRGSRIDGSWTTQGYYNILLALHEAGLPTITKNNVKSQQKCLKDRWREVHDLFSGFGWNKATKCFEVEDEVLRKLDSSKVIKDDNIQLLKMIISHYFLLISGVPNPFDTTILWRSCGQTTGPLEVVKGQPNWHVHTQNLSVDLGDHNMDYIHEPLEFNVADHELPCSPVAHVQSINNPNNNPFVPSQPSGGTLSSKGSKRKCPMVDVIENSSIC